MDEPWEVLGWQYTQPGVITFTVQTPTGDLYTASCENGHGWDIYDSRNKIPGIVEQTIIERVILRYLLDVVARTT